MTSRWRFSDLHWYILWWLETKEMLSESTVIQGPFSHGPSLSCKSPAALSRSLLPEIVKKKTAIIQRSKRFVNVNLTFLFEIRDKTLTSNTGIGTATPSIAWRASKIRISNIWSTHVSHDTSRWRWGNRRHRHDAFLIGCELAQLSSGLIFWIVLKNR